MRVDDESGVRLVQGGLGAGGTHLAGEDCLGVGQGRAVAASSSQRKRTSAHEQDHHSDHDQHLD
ncbi:MAG: hypothetical protein FJ399_19345 [Verrucomicrobia bacterium]|nr:hypothetical protein [Verrucomicrobiota bacterium]